MTDEELDRTCVERCLKGDLDAFGLLIERYERPVFNAVLHMVGNYDDARELCQQAFMKAFERLATYDTSRKFFSWLYRVAINESINHVKSRHPAEPLHDHFPQRDPNPEEQLDAAERDRRLRDAVLSLDPIYRSVVILRHFSQLSYREAAEALSIPEKTVKSRLFTARQMLRELLEANGDARAEQPSRIRSGH